MENSKGSDQEDNGVALMDDVLDGEDQIMNDDENDDQDEINDEIDGDGNDVMGNQQPNCSGNSQLTLWRKKCQIRGILTTNPIDNLHGLMSFNEFSKSIIIFPQRLGKLSIPPI